MPTHASNKRSESKPSFSRKGKKGPDPRDIHVGRRVRVMRLERRMSQTALADQLGLTFQQVQKYEKGVNRIGAGRLQTIAEIFQVPVAALFSSSAPAREHRDTLFELVDSAAALRLLRAYSRLPNSRLKSALVQLATEMAGGE